jgi:hypothetical protein
VDLLQLRTPVRREVHWRRSRRRSAATVVEGIGGQLVDAPDLCRRLDLLGLGGRQIGCGWARARSARARDCSVLVAKGGSRARRRPGARRYPWSGSCGRCNSLSSSACPRLDT